MRHASRIRLAVASCLALSLCCSNVGLSRESPFIRGDVDQDQILSVTDAIRIFGFLFSGVPASFECNDAADVDDSGDLNITDGIFELQFLFLGGAPPPPPGSGRAVYTSDDCGADPTPDVPESELDCRFFFPCIVDTEPPEPNERRDIIVEQRTTGGTVVGYAEPLAVDDWDPDPDVVCEPASGSLFPQGTTDVTCTATDRAGNRGQSSFAVMVQDTTPPSLGQSAALFAASRAVDAGAGPRGLGVADLNGDGAPDIAVADSGNAAVIVFLAVEAGVLGEPTSFATAASPGALATGDLNADTFPDVVVLGTADDDLSVLINDGLGGLAARSDQFAGPMPADVAIGDLDGNSTADIVVALEGADALRVLFGDGDGGFDAGTIHPAGPSPAALVLADLDADGHLDAATAGGASGSVSVLLGDGAGDLALAASYPAGADLRDLASEDLDGDGWPDLAAPDFAGSTLWVLHGRGAGALDAPVPHAVGQEPAGLAIADLNADGAPDLVTADSGDDTLTVLLADGAGGYSPSSLAVGSDPLCVAARDLNGDGRPDLLATSFGANTLEIADGDGGLEDLTAEASSAAGATVAYTSPAAADAADPELDMVCFPSSAVLFPLGSTLVTCGATDDSGNRSQIDFTVTVRDTTPPSFAQVDDMVFEQQSPQGAVVHFEPPAAFDAVDSRPLVVCEPPPGSTFPPGTTVVSCRAIDDTGNESPRVTFDLTVVDTTPPALEQPPDISVDQETLEGTVVDYAEPAATDAADPDPDVVCEPASGTLFPVGATDVTCTATDAAGNQSEVEFTIGVAVDVSPPVITVLSPGEGSCIGRAELIDIAFVDNETGTLPDTLVIFANGTEVTSAFERIAESARAPVSALPPESLVEGTNTLEIQVTDEAGNRGSRLFDFNLDLTVPALALDPPEGALVKPDRVLTATYSDPGCGIDEASFQAVLDERDVTDMFTVGPDSATAELSLEDGNHTLTVSLSDTAGNVASSAVSFDVEPPAVNLELTLAPGDPAALHIASENDLTLRAQTPSGATALLFSGTVRLTTSDRLPPLHDLEIAMAPSDRGQVTLTGVALFRTLGPVVVNATSLEPPPLDITGTLVVTVVVRQPVIFPEPPSETGPEGTLQISGFSFPGEAVRLILNGAEVDTVAAGPGADFAFAPIVLESGTHDLRVEATDPATGLPASSEMFTVEGPPAPEQPQPTFPQEPAQDDADAHAASLYEVEFSGWSAVLSSGETRFGRVDLRIPGRGQIQFVMARRYRSRLTYDGPLGHGWDFSYNEKLFVQPNGDVVRSNGAGHVDIWKRNPDGSFAAPTGHFGTLTAEPDRTFTLRSAYGFRRVYRPDGRLRSHSDRFGNTMTFSYDPRGNLSLVSDAYGRQVEFEFQTMADDRDRLVAVRDFAGREVIYSYDENADLVAVRSPVVNGTSTGNDFPDGRTERYGYSSGLAQAELNHNLLTVTYPQEVADGGPPAHTWTYGADGVDFDRALTANVGGVNASGIAAGGLATFDYREVNQGEPADQPDLERLEVTVTERNGNQSVRLLNEFQHEIVRRRPTRGLRAAEPPFFETRSFYDSDGQLVRRVLPEQNEIRRSYDSVGPRAARRNLLEIRLVADAAREGGEDLVTTMTYEPVYNQLRTITDPRGNATGFVPPLASNRPDRYTTRFIFDYQEGSDPIPDVEKYGIDVSTMARGLGDLNGDGRVDQVAGNAVRKLDPAVELSPESNEAIRLGSTTQEILTELRWNDRGQPLATIDPEGNLTSFVYFPENDPDGDSSAVPGQTSNAPAGYLRSVTLDGGLTSRRTATAPPAALETRFSYDPVGNIIRLRNPRGVVTAMEVNELNEPLVITRGFNVALAIVSGQLITGEGPFAYRVRMFYDQNGRVTMTETEDRDDVSATADAGDYVDRTYTWDILNRLVSSTVEVDATTTLTTQQRYDENELLTRVTLPRGNAHTISYDERNLPFRITLGAGTPEAGTLRIDYDRNGNRARLVDAEDNDEDGQPEETVVGYDGFDRPTSVANALGTVHRLTYDPASNVTKKEVWGHPPDDPDAPAVLLSDVRQRWDELKRRYQVDRALFVADGFTTERAVSLRDEDSDGFVTARQEFDALSRTTFRVEDDGQTTQTIYDGAGRPVELIDALGNRSVTNYDKNGNPVRVWSFEVSPERRVPQQTFTTFYVWDQLDRLVRVTENAGRTTRFGYDSRDNLTARSDAEGPLLESDPLGLFPGPGQTGQVNAAGNTTRWSYDGADRILSRVRDLRVGGMGGNPLDSSNPYNPDGDIAQAFGWDPNSNLDSVGDDNGNRTSFEYDARDRLVSQTNADGELFRVVFDRDDNLVEIGDPNGTVVSCTYDAGNRLVELEVARGPGVVGTIRETYGYDGLDRLTSSADSSDGSSSELERVYDSLDRLLEERQGQGGDMAAVSSVYSGDGSRLVCRYPGGRELSSTFDALNRLKVLDDSSGEILRAIYIGPGTRELERAYGNGTKLTFLNGAGNAATGYDNSKRPVRPRHLLPPSSGGGAFVDRQYGYNREDMRISVGRLDEPGLPEDSYELDSAYRIVTTALDQGAPAIPRPDLIEYRLDGAGNRREVEATTGGSAATETYSVNEMNEYTSVDGAARSHDRNGNRVDDGSRLFQYDYRSRLVNVLDKASGNLIAHYVYDTSNRRRLAELFDPGASPPDDFLGGTRFLYDEWRIVEERDGSTDTTIATYAYGPAHIDDVVQAEFSSPQFPPPADAFYVHQDARRNVVAITFGKDAAAVSAGGWVSQKLIFDDFGNRLRVFAAGDDPDTPLPTFLFQARRLDIETGLYYYRNRYYDPRTGRFLTRDPVWDPVSAGNLYAFAGNAPSSRVAPFGLRAAAPERGVSISAPLGGGPSPAQSAVPDETGPPLEHRLTMPAELSMPAGSFVRPLDLARGRRGMFAGPAGEQVRPRSPTGRLMERILQRRGRGSIEIHRAGRRISERPWKWPPAFEADFSVRPGALR